MKGQMELIVWIAIAVAVIVTLLIFAYTRLSQLGVQP